MHHSLAMTTEESPELQALRQELVKQAEAVRNLKAQGAGKDEIKAAVAVLNTIKDSIEKLEPKKQALNAGFNKRAFEDLMKRRFFYGLAFDIYGGTAGLYDLGPMGCALQSNILQEWRQHFILEEQMLEIAATMLTPEPVLKTSGHVDRFTDLMVQDTVTGDFFRADHLMEGHLEKVIAAKDTPADTRRRAEDLLPLIDGMSGDKDRLWATMQEWKVKSPEGGNPISEPIAFNLMFPTSIGPTGLVKGFLRPETAQGIFTNFKRLLEFNNKKMPFAAAQIGHSFRNEISPRSGLLRVREFLMAEIEHFVNPDKKKHPKFDKVRNLPVMLYSAHAQESGQPMHRMTIGDAVAKGVIDNETLGYFIARIYLFLTKIGIRDERLRFRQHMCTEMAHYATDCWDAECFTSYGWIECVGCADRSAYDLSRHSEATGIDLVAQEELPEPVVVDVVEALPVKQELGKAFKQDAKAIMDKLAKLSINEVADLETQLSAGAATLQIDGKAITLPKEMVQVKRSKKTVHTNTYTPNVIEPSFGIGRILYCVLEQNFWTRDGDEQRTVLSLPPPVAPIKSVILPISASPDFDVFIRRLAEAMTEADVTYKVDDSGTSLGRRYARTDELGAAFACTVDFETTKNDTITIREKDSMEQIRLPLEEAADVIKRIVRGKMTWADAAAKYPKFIAQEA